MWGSVPSGSGDGPVASSSSTAQRLRGGCLESKLQSLGNMSECQHVAAVQLRLEGWPSPVRLGVVFSPDMVRCTEPLRELAPSTKKKGKEVPIRAASWRQIFVQALGLMSPGVEATGRD